jgi:hypothetical protein
MAPSFIRPQHRFVDPVTEQVYHFLEDYLEARHLDLQIGVRGGKPWMKLRTRGGIVVAELSGSSNEEEVELLLELMRITENKIRLSAILTDSDGQVLEP